MKPSSVKPMRGRSARAELAVGDLMTDELVAVGPDEDLATLHQLMLDHNVRHMPVVDRERNLIGLVSHRDLLRNHLIEQVAQPEAVEEMVLRAVTVREVMTTVVESATPEMDIRDAGQRMLDNKYGCLPVVRRGKLVGILTEADFVRLLAMGH